MENSDSNPKTQSEDDNNNLSEIKSKEKLNKKLKKKFKKKLVLSGGWHINDAVFYCRYLH